MNQVFLTKISLFFFSIYESCTDTPLSFKAGNRCPQRYSRKELREKKDNANETYTVRLESVSLKATSHNFSFLILHTTSKLEKAVPIICTSNSSGL